MSTKLKVSIIASSLAILLFTVVGGFVNVRASSNDGAYRQLSVYSEVLSRIRLEYVEEPNIPGVTEGALHGVLGSVNGTQAAPGEITESWIHVEIAGPGDRIPRARL